MTTYEINTDDRSYSTSKARDAAEVACNWKRRGMAPVAYVVRNEDMLTIETADITTVAVTAQRLAHA